MSYRSVERQIRLRCGRTITHNLKNGQYGDGIDLVQLALNSHPPSAFPPLAVDGIFGPITERRVREFQRSQRLDPDGVVGPDTRRALGL